MFLLSLFSNILYMAKQISPTQTKTYRSINAQITKWVDENSILFINKGNWYAGITNDTNRRKIEHAIKNNDKIRCWKCWNAKSLRISNALEDSLSRRGFSNAPHKGGAIATSKYIYVYKKFATGLEKN